MTSQSRSQTNDRDFEYIEHETFPGADHKRQMSWKAGQGYIIIHKMVCKTNKETANEDVEAGTEIIVVKTTFKLVHS